MSDHLSIVLRDGKLIVSGTNLEASEPGFARGDCSLSRGAYSRLQLDLYAAVSECGDCGAAWDKCQCPGPNEPEEKRPPTRPQIASGADVNQPDQGSTLTHGDPIKQQIAIMTRETLIHIVEELCVALYQDDAGKWDRNLEWSADTPERAANALPAPLHFAIELVGDRGGQ